MRRSQGERTARANTWPVPRSPGARRASPKRIAALAALAGLAAGLAAAALLSVVKLCTSLFLSGLGGYQPATLASDGHVHAASGFARPWLIPLIVAVGALVASLMVHWAAPETGGHGTDAAIDAAHRDPTGMRARVPLVKMIASAITLGSGGSGGTEGPIAQIAAAIASVLSRRARISPQQAQIILMTGLAAGIGSIFRAPLAGALLGAELLYVRGMALRVIGPALLACGVAFGVFGAIDGFGPMFGRVAASWPGGAAAWWTFAVLGLVCGLVGRLYAGTFYAVHNFTVRITARTARYRLPPYVPPVLGALLVGALGLAVPGVLGPGYGTAQVAMDPHWALQTSIWVLLAIPFAKIAATSLSIGSGGSGGIFGPGLVIGAAVGCALWRLAELHGLAGGAPAPYVIAGMAACLGPIIHAPLGVTVLVVEATQAPGMLGPALLATVIASLIVRTDSIYRSQPLSKFATRARRQTAAPSLETTPGLAAAPGLRVTPGLAAMAPAADFRAPAGEYAFSSEHGPDRGRVDGP